jgi:hypothetical protein
MEIDEAFGIKASFQVIPKTVRCGEGGAERDWRSRVRSLIHDLNHDSNLFDDREEVLLGAQSINRYVREHRALGFRAGRMYRNAECNN